ncbi:unnamed protein product [Arctogadus glacialis]
MTVSLAQHAARQRHQERWLPHKSDIKEPANGVWRSPGRGTARCDVNRCPPTTTPISPPAPPHSAGGRRFNGHVMLFDV